MKRENKARVIRFRREWLSAVIFIGCCVAFLIYFVMTRGVGDHTAPEIHVPQEPLKISVQSEKELLLSGITAEDDHDGDVTGSLVVETVSDLYDGNRATITCAAFDMANNVSKATRAVEFTDYVPPRFTLSGPLIFAEGAADKVFDVIGAEDVLDGTIDDLVKGTLVKGATALEKAGLYKVEFRVTNSLGDTVHLTLPVEIVEPKEDGPRVELTDYLVYLKVGQSFDPQDYIKQEKSKDLVASAAVRPIQVDSAVNTSRPGTYTVTYTDESEHPIRHTSLIVIVEE